MNALAGFVAAGLPWVLLLLLPAGCGPKGTDAGGGGSDAGPASDGGMSASDSGGGGGSDAGTGADAFALSTPMDFATDQVPAFAVDALGGPTVNWLLDTGFPYGVADVDIYPAASYGAQGVTVGAFGTSFPGVYTVVNDSFGPPPMGGVQQIGGILSAGFMLAYASVFDYHDETLWLMAPLAGDPGVGAATGAATALPFTPLGGGSFNFGAPVGVVSWPATRIILNGSIEGTPATFLLDTGASLCVIEETFFAALGDPSRPTITGVEPLGGAGTLSASISRVADVTVGGVVVPGPAVFVIPGYAFFGLWTGEVGTTVHAVIGGSFLREFLTTINYPAGEVRLAPFTDTTHINPNEWVGPGFRVLEDVSGDYVLLDVWSNTDAELQGLVEGMMLAEVNGVPVTSYTRRELQDLFTTFVPGSTIDLGIRNGATLDVYTVLIDDHLPAYP